MANIPADLKYTKSHEWLKSEDGLLTAEEIAARYIEECKKDRKERGGEIIC